MSGEHERELELRLRAQAAPAARPEFRSALRERFLAGAAAAPAVDVLPDDDRPAARGRSGPARWKTWVTLAAAACIAALLWLTKPTPILWKVLPGTSATTVRVDGVRLRVDEPEALARALNDAHSLEAEDGELRLAYSDQYALGLAASVRLAFGASGSTGGTDVFSLALEGAALRLVTGPGFRGHDLFLRSGDAVVHVTGTAFAFDNCADGACVCGLHGRIEVSRKGGKPAALEGQRQCWIPKDGSELGWGEVHAAHIAPLQDMERAARSLWNP